MNQKIKTVLLNALTACEIAIVVCCTLLMVASVITVVSHAKCAHNPEPEIESYPAITIVCGIDPNSDLVFVRDANDEVWSFVGGEDWEINDLCAVEFNDMGTESIYDDEIESVRYIGHLDARNQ